MANAAYCFGTVLAVQLTQRLPARRMLVGFALLFLVASVLAAAAPTPGLFVAGHVLQGLATALMLIAAAPALITGWPVARLRPSAVTMNLGIFGAVALGPVVGGIVAGGRDWQLLFWVVAGLGAAALAMILLTFEDQPPQDRGAPVDVVSIGVAAAGTGLAFLGVGELAAHGFTEAIVLVPLLAGVALIVFLIGHQFVVSDPLMPVRKLAHTIPVAAIAIAMAAGAASVALVELTQSALELQKASPTHVGVLFLPELGGAILTAALFGAIVFTRWVPTFALCGVVLLAGAGAVLSGVATGTDALVLAAAALVGVGVGGSVSPALFAAGFSLEAELLPRVFALIELLRGVAAFLAAPLLLHLSETVGSGPAAGIEAAVWLATAIALAGGLLAAAVFALGRARLQRPDLERWLEGEGPAIDSPPLGGARLSGPRPRVS